MRPSQTLLRALLLCSFLCPLHAQGFRIEKISIEQLHVAYREGKTSAREVVQHHLDRITAYDKQGPLLNSLIT